MNTIARLTVGVSIKFDCRMGTLARRLRGLVRDGNECPSYLPIRPRECTTCYVIVGLDPVTLFRSKYA